MSRFRRIKAFYHNLYYSLIVCITACATIAILVGEAECQDVNRGVLCGPKCVNVVLEYYDKPTVDPLEMTKYLSQYDDERGTSFRALESFLIQNGLHCRQIRVDQNSDIKWRTPVIAHLVFSDTQQHFVTWLPGESTSYVSLFDGVSSIRRMSIANWFKYRSGVMLLTSIEPIPESITPVQTASAYSDNLFYVSTSIVYFGLGATLFFRGLLFKKVIR